MFTRRAKPEPAPSAAPAAGSDHLAEVGRWLYDQVRAEDAREREALAAEIRARREGGRSGG